MGEEPLRPRCRCPRPPGGRSGDHRADSPGAASRRSRIWKVIAWILALFVVFNALLLVLGYAASVQLDTEVVTVEETILLEE